MTDGSPQPERYTSFADCLGDSRHVIAAIRRHIRDPEKSNAFWDAFEGKLANVGDTERHTPDELHIVCSYIVYIEELFELYDDTEGLALLEKLEVDCC
jgi:hypothetical protein